MRTALIGDLHGDATRHLTLTREHPFTLQLGDCGDDFTYLQQTPSTQHKVLGGNHDNYPELVKLLHYLGDYGTWRGIFYMRGAWSIDIKWRVPGRDWWPEEELTDDKANEAIESYSALKPDVVVTHDGPPQCTRLLLADKLGLFGSELVENRTSIALGKLYEAHQPLRWYFGHWHVSRGYSVGRTQFQTLGIGECVEVDAESLQESGPRIR
ncbi:MAG TPA: metallophosphoesterase [Candidatus Polarisedimenticolaceae bacterium]|nr:metallophosphoesterase [Candidatus Polarisedimenticolaceae bacterium]